MLQSLMENVSSWQITDTRLVESLHGGFIDDCFGFGVVTFELLSVMELGVVAVLLQSDTHTSIRGEAVPLILFCYFSHFIKICWHFWIGKYACMYACVYMYMHVCMYIWMYSCGYMYTYACSTRRMSKSWSSVHFRSSEQVFWPVEPCLKSAQFLNWVRICPS